MATFPFSIAQGRDAVACAKYINDVYSHEKIIFDLQVRYFAKSRVKSIASFSNDFAKSTRYLEVFFAKKLLLFRLAAA